MDFVSFVLNFHIVFYLFRLVSSFLLYYFNTLANLGNISKVYNISLQDGIDPATFRDIVYRMVHARTSVKNVDEVAGAIEYQYTFWTKPDNKTAVRQNLIDVSSSM